MSPADRLYVGLSGVLTAIGLSILIAAACTGWYGLHFAWLGVYGGVICALLGLHGQGLLMQFARHSFLYPLPVFVCLCLDLLVAALLAVGLLIAIA